MASPLAKLKPKRRWMQVSLRTVLVFVALLCVALTMWVVPIERRRRAVAAIEALDGTVYYATSESFSVAFLRRWLPAVFFDEVSDVVLTNPKVTDTDLADLQELTSLRRLFLYNTQATDAGLAHLQGLTRLEWLYLDYTPIADAGLAHFQRMTSLQELHLSYTQVTDAGLAHLQGLTSLQELHLNNTQVSDAGLAHLQELTSLQQLYLNNTQVTEAGLAQLRRGLPNCQIKGP